MIAAIDPGQSNAQALLGKQTILRKQGQYSYDLPVILGIDYWGGFEPTRDVIVTELQWLFDVRKKRTTLRLAFDAGLMLGRLCERMGCQGYALPVDVWKGQLFDGAHKNKLVHLNLICRLLTPNELARLPKTPRRYDALSAIGIGWAFHLLGVKAEGYSV